MAKEPIFFPSPSAKPSSLPLQEMPERPKAGIFVELPPVENLDSDPHPNANCLTRIENGTINTETFDTNTTQRPSPKASILLLKASSHVERSQSSRLILWGAAGLFSLFFSLFAYDFIFSLITRNILLGGIGISLGLMLAFGIALLVLAEFRAIGRMQTLDRIRQTTNQTEAASTKEAQIALDTLLTLYENRPDLEWQHAQFQEQRQEALDTPSLLHLAETTLMPELDARAIQTVQESARAVAIGTAVSPILLLDAFAALYLNLRMARRIAETYGGRAGWGGSIRVFRRIATHIVATGLISIGDDLIAPILGSSVAAKVSRRFGEGLINGAMTARIGTIAIDACRPLPFYALPKPSAKTIALAALKGSLLPPSAKKESEETHKA